LQKIDIFFFRGAINGNRSSPKINQAEFQTHLIVDKLFAWVWFSSLQLFLKLANKKPKPNKTFFGFCNFIILAALKIKDLIFSNRSPISINTKSAFVFCPHFFNPADYFIGISGTTSRIFHQIPNFFLGITA
jgi:hypothetical protein